MRAKSVASRALESEFPMLGEGRSTRKELLSSAFFGLGAKTGSSKSQHHLRNMSDSAGAAGAGAGSGSVVAASAPAAPAPSSSGGASTTATAAAAGAVTTAPAGRVVPEQFAVSWLPFSFFGFRFCPAVKVWGGLWGWGVGGSGDSLMLVGCAMASAISTYSLNSMLDRYVGKRACSTTGCGGEGVGRETGTQGL
jgi:hypothetical protein